MSLKHFRTWIGSEEGKAESSAPMILVLIILGIGMYLSYKFIPVKVRSMKFRNEVQEILNIDYAREYKTFVQGGFNEFTMREKILQAAKKYGIPIKDDERNVVVEWPENKRFIAKINYTEEIELPFYGIYKWPFHMYIEQYKEH
jgi:cell division protein FtsL